MTYTTLIKPVLEFGSAIFFIASDSNLKKLEIIQLSAARIISGLRNSCPNNLVLYECDIQPLNMRRNYCLTKYFDKLLSYCDQHRTSQYLKHWKYNQRLKRNSPFSQALAQNLSFNVEHHCRASFINPVLGLQRVTFHHPELLKQLALEVIDGIPLDAAKIYTDGSKGEINTTGTEVLIELPGHVFKFKRINADHASVFRTELIAIMWGLSFINTITDITVSEIWIFTDSQSSKIYRIGHLSATAPAGVFLVFFNSFRIGTQFIYSGSLLMQAYSRTMLRTTLRRQLQAILWIRKTTWSLH
ncbi:uncharacterized protein TNCV_1600961 [Trichonephila clavipes]|nr:uncharacterized protein TNCV_1600961 [Trichonephila clavipes]